MTAIIRSVAWRIAIGYGVLFSLSVLMLLVLIYWSTAGYVTRQMEAVIEAEVQGLAERYRLTGPLGLRDLITERLLHNTVSSSIYLLADPAFRLLAGNLRNWPEAAQSADHWIEFELYVAGDDARRSEVHRARARYFRLPDGSHLLVGRNVRDLEEMRSAIVRAVAWGIGMAVVLAVAGAWWMRRRVAVPIESISHTSRRIMQGELSERIESQGSGDEFDELVANLNAMLDRIETLMDDVRRVSDNIAHDLRTPLGRLRVRLELLRDATGDNASTALADAALDEADQMLTTFNALLRIARIETEQRKHAFKPVDLATIGDDVAELYAPVAEVRGVIFRYSGVEALVDGDADLLFQSFANLLDNAMKYTPENGTVTLHITAAADRVTVVVADNGSGVPPAEREAVLRRFYRLERARDTPGSGLGLSLVAAVAQLHEATLTLDDNAPGLVVRLQFRRARR